MAATAHGTSHPGTRTLTPSHGTAERHNPGSGRASSSRDPVTPPRTHHAEGWPVRRRLQTHLPQPPGRVHPQHGLRSTRTAPASSGRRRRACRDRVGRQDDICSRKTDAKPPPQNVLRACHEPQPKVQCNSYYSSSGRGADGRRGPPMAARRRESGHSGCGARGRTLLYSSSALPSSRARRQRARRLRDRHAQRARESARSARGATP